MAFVEKCFCCSLPIASGFFAAYLLVAYLIAFAFELLWILESEVGLPAAAVLLCAGYFAMGLFAALLIHGLATKNMLCLVAWMFSVTILTFPEAGLVIYMSIQYWRLESIYGITELACWLIRIVINVIQIVLVQSLYTMWKDEELVDKRLRDLTMAAMPIPRESLPPPLNSQYYHNNGYDHSMENINHNLKRYGSMPHLWSGHLPNNIMPPLPIDAYQYYTTQSEFNASIFVPHITPDEGMLGSEKKAQSLVDLRFLDQAPNADKFILPWMSESSQNHFSDTNSAIIPNYRMAMSEIAVTPPPGRLTKCQSVDALNESNKNGHIIKNRTGFYAQPIASYGVPIYYGPLDGPDFLIYKKQIDKLTSKNSLTMSNASAEDVQKYRDVAL